MGEAKQRKLGPAMAQAFRNPAELNRFFPYRTIMVPPWDAKAITALALGDKHFWTEVERGHITLGAVFTALHAGGDGAAPEDQVAYALQHLEAGQCVLIMSDTTEGRDRIRRDILNATKQ